MKKQFLCFLFVIFACIGFAHADTITLNWLNENGTTNQTTTCETGGDLILPTTPTKTGYDFVGWVTYTPIEYLQGTGTQWIDTGFIPNQDTRIKTKVKFNSVTNSDTSVFGSGKSAREKAFEFYLWNRELSFNYNNTNWQHTTINIGDIVIVDWNKNIVNYSINGVDKDRVVHTYAPFTTPYQMRIFAVTRPESVTTVTHAGKIQIYYLQIYDNDVLVHDFIPVINNYYNIPCMYDRVENKFYYNAGTGHFTAGPVINNQ